MAAVDAGCGAWGGQSLGALAEDAGPAPLHPRARARSLGGEPRPIQTCDLLPGDSEADRCLARTVPFDTTTQGGRGARQARRPLNRSRTAAAMLPSPPSLTTQRRVSTAPNSALQTIARTMCRGQSGKIPRPTRCQQCGLALRRRHVLNSQRSQSDKVDCTSLPDVHGLLFVLIADRRSGTPGGTRGSRFRFDVEEILRCRLRSGFHCHSDARCSGVVWTQTGGQQGRRQGGETDVPLDRGPRPERRLNAWIPAIFCGRHSRVSSSLEAH